MKKIIIIGSGILGGIFFGTVMVSPQDVINADSDIIANPCEQDECEIGAYCIDNPGMSTQCRIDGPIQCKTLGCS